MTKKFLALTMVLVLAAGFAAVAAEHEDDRALTGTWNNELILEPGADDTFAAYDSVLSVDYTTGGISYSSDTTLSLSGLTEQEFGVDSSVGLLDLSSTLNMDVDGGNLRYWESSADLTLGGVAIGTTFYLQSIDWDPTESGYQATFWPEVSSSLYPLKPSFASVDPTATQTDSFVVPASWDTSVESPVVENTSVSDFHDYGSGLELSFSGETPGGVSIDVTNTFGMMPASEAETELTDELADHVETLIENEFSISAFSNWDTVNGNTVITELADLVGPLTEPTGVTTTDADITGNGTASSTNFEEQAVVVWLVSQLSVPNADDSTEDDSTFKDLIEDWNEWIADKNAASTYSPILDSADSDVSADIRSEFVSALKQSIAIGGVAGETGMVVNTEFELGDVKFFVDSAAASSDAYVMMGLDTVEVGPEQYGASSLQYYSTVLELDNLSIGCCDFSNETKFTEHDGFKYTEFDFSMEMETFPIDVAATLKWDNDPDTTDTGKVVTITPSLTTDWSCFEVYTTLGSSDGDIDSLSVDGFELSAEMGHVKVTGVTALGSNDLTDLGTSGSYHGFDEVLRIDKLDSAGDLDFTLDYYTNMGSSGNGLMPVAIEGSASYPVSSQFDIGTNLAWVDYSTYSGLQEVGLTFDYSF